MTYNNFLIDYVCYDKNGKVLAEGKVRAKRKFNAFEAQCTFEKHLKNKYPNFGHLIINSCNLDIFNSFNSTFDSFGDYFKTK